MSDGRLSGKRELHIEEQEYWAEVEFLLEELWVQDPPRSFEDETADEVMSEGDLE